MTSFTAYCPDVVKRYEAGWAFLIVLSLFLIVNLFIILKKMLRGIWLIFLKYYRRFYEWLKKKYWV